ncbi:hypothetical protein [Mycobacteroides abscessus]|uniref:hypothetical protein n=1 Tax=Mycobacteroides abscessus TaxID=36809 RepID=UPI000A52613F|nr:hypothetical protein [Mycobacteroides abscessus]
MALSMPNRRFSKVIIRKGWPECPPSLIGDLAAAGRAEHENAQAAAGSVRRAIAEVESEEKGIFAAASVHAYKQELGLWNELAEGCAKESPMLFQAGAIQQTLRLEIMRIDEEAHAEIEAAEAKFAGNPMALGAEIARIVPAAGLEVDAAVAKATAEIEALAAAAPVWTGAAASKNGSGAPAPHGGNAVHPVDSVTEKVAESGAITDRCLLHPRETMAVNQLQKATPRKRPSLHVSRRVLRTGRSKPSRRFDARIIGGT